MKFLVVSYYYLPEQTPRAFRTDVLISSLINAGHEVTLVLPQNRSGQYNNSKVNIIELPSGFLFNKYKHTQIIKECKLYDISSSNLLISKIKQFAKKILYWPFDRSFEFFLSSYFIHFKKDDKHYDALLAIGLPITSYLVGIVLAKKLNINYKIADCGDPYALGISNNKIKIYVEKKILSQYNTVFTSTSKFNNLLKDIDINSFLLPHFYEKTYNKQKQLDIKLNNKNYNYVYAGSFYHDIRNPSNFLNAIKIFNELHEKKIKIFLFVNLRDDFVLELRNKYQYWLGEYIEFISYVERDYLYNFYDLCDTLVNFQNKHEIQTPSKIAEYSLFDKKFLNINLLDDDKTIYTKLTSFTTLNSNDNLNNKKYFLKLITTC